VTEKPRLESRVMRLAELVTYQQDSVVSRQITKTEAGNITLFAFAAGQQLSEHTAPFDALLHVLEGEAEVRIAEEGFLLAAGDAIILPAGIPHGVTASQPFKMLLTMIRSGK
jgi:quercetin dioxygenase-like cupin family protein